MSSLFIAVLIIFVIAHSCVALYCLSSKHTAQVRVATTAQELREELDLSWAHPHPLLTFSKNLTGLSTPTQSSLPPALAAHTKTPFIIH